VTEVLPEDGAIGRQYMCDIFSKQYNYSIVLVYLVGKL
jgi:hypothetical protein